MEIRRYIALIWHWAWLIILVTLITGSTAYIINKQTPEVYSSSSRLLVDLAPGIDYRDLLIEERLTQTFIEWIKTRPVLEETDRRLELQGYTAGKISVSPIPGTQMIRVTAEHSNPEAAAATVNTISQVFIDTIRETQQERYASSIADWDDRLVSLESEIDGYSAEISAIDPADVDQQANLLRLERQLREVQYSYTAAFEQRDRLVVQEAQGTNSVSIIEDALPGSAPIRPRVLSNTMLATVIGAMAALGIVLLIEYLDDTVKSPDQIASDTGLSTLGAISFIKGNEPSDRLVTFRTPRSPISEAFRVLRTNISFASIDDEMPTMLVTSSSPGEGKSTTAANLAVAIAQTGKRVILIDADLRRPSQHKIFDVSNNQGLTTALLDADTPVSYHVQSTRVPGMRVLSSGPLPPNPAELLNSKRMSTIIDNLQSEADMIVIDTPPTLTVADASILAPLVAGCLFVVQLGSTRRDAIKQAQGRLVNAGAKLFGVVLNQMRPSRTGYYNYYYYYRYYAYEYSSEKPNRRRGLLGWLPKFNRS